MIQSLTGTYKNQKIIPAGTFIVQSGSKLIIKNQQEKLEFYLSDISNIRILRKRNFYPNIITFCLIVISAYSNTLTFQTHSNYLLFANIFFVSVLLINIYFLKNYNYKLLINIGKFGFSEIHLPKKNIQNVESFLKYFNINSNSNAYRPQSEDYF